jgi:hypothetical protein
MQAIRVSSRQTGPKKLQSMEQKAPLSPSPVLAENRHFGAVQAAAGLEAL